MSHGEGERTLEDAARVSVFLRALADRAEREPRFASALLADLEESGLLTRTTARRTGATTRKPRQAREERSQALDPVAIWRSQGEDALRRALDGLELMDLLAVVRAQRLDPARVSSRWTARERVITLIMDQVKARMNHGRAFERV